MIVFLAVVDLVATAAYLVWKSGLHYSGPRELIADQYAFSFLVFVVAPTMALVLVRLVQQARLTEEAVRARRMRALTTAAWLAALAWAGTTLWLGARLAGWPPLHFAVRHGNLALARTLLRLGAATDSCERYEGWMPLNLAVARDDLEMATLLLDYGASPNALDRRGTSALINAAWGNARMTALLLERGGVPTVVGAGGWSALETACWRRDAPLAHLLLDAMAPHRGVPVPSARRRASQAEVDLVDALDRGDEAALERLLERLRRRHTWTRVRYEQELFQAMNAGNLEGVREALDEGADVDARNTIGATPLIVAAAADDATMVCLFLERGAGVDLADHNGRSALMAAAASGGSEAVRELLAARPLLEATDRSGRTALLLAVAAGNREAASHLLAAGARPDAHDTVGGTVLDLALRYGDQRLADELVRHGAAARPADPEGLDPEQRVREESTVSSASGWERELLHAINVGDAEGAARVLAVQGIDARLAALNGGSALLWATACGEEAVALRLVDLGAAVDAESNDGVTPLIEAARRRQTGIARLLLARGADPARQTRKGWSALMFAAERGDLEMVQLLLAHRAPVDARNARGESALAVAVKNGRDEVAAVLQARGAPE